MIIVVNDKESSLLQYRLLDSGALKLESENNLSGNRGESLAMKLAAITKVPVACTDQQDEWILYAITAHDRGSDPYRRFLRVKMGPDGDALEVQTLKLPHLNDVVQKLFRHRWPKIWPKIWYKIEALALGPISCDRPDDPSQERGADLYVGIRAVGPDYRSPHYRVLILKSVVSQRLGF